MCPRRSHACQTQAGAQELALPHVHYREARRADGCVDGGCPCRFLSLVRAQPPSSHARTPLGRVPVRGCARARESARVRAGV